MKYKIQVESLWGWSDLKTSIDGSDYEVETFDRIQDAQDEIDMIINNLDNDGNVPDSYRIVSQDTQQEIDLYQ
jgi:hypothetical protein